MTEIRKRVSPGEVIEVSRILRRAGTNPEEAGRALGVLLVDLDRQGYDAEITVRRKRGRPSNLSRFLSRQGDLPLDTK